MSVIKTNQYMLYGAKVAVGSEINTKLTNIAWAEYTIFLILNLLVHHIANRF